VLFNYLLSAGSELKTLVPIANAVALGVTAAVDLALGEQVADLRVLAIGIVLVGLGVVLCG
jgi:hypothetical protein